MDVKTSGSEATFPGDGAGGDTPAEGGVASGAFSAGGGVGPYRVVREIGRGGQGRVYEAFDDRLGRKVALKVLSSTAPKASDRFRREAEAASRLVHPGVCAVFDVGVDDGRPYLAMRFVEGETLARRLGAARRAKEASGSTAAPALFHPPENERAPNETEAIAATVRFVEAVARAVHAAHEAGVVHRDLKPGNVMIEKDGAPVVLDFGLAGLVDADAATLTRTGEIFGTPSYMSPEQIAPDRGKPDRRTDVYALGVVLFEALTLRRPFEGPTRDALFGAILAEDPPDVRTLLPSAPKDLAAVIDVALEKEPRRRYATALAFADDLKRVLDGEPVAAKPPRAFERVVRHARRRPAETALILTLLVGIPTVGSFLASYLAGRPLARARAASVRREEAEALLDRACVARVAGDSKAALAAIDAALALDPGAPEGPLLRAATLLDLDPNDSAARAALAAIAAEDADRSAPVDRAWVAALATALLPPTPTVGTATTRSEGSDDARRRAETAFRALLNAPEKRTPGFRILAALAAEAARGGDPSAVTFADSAAAALASRLRR